MKKNIGKKEVFGERLEEEQGLGEGGEYGEQAKVSADQEEELGGHKDSFVSVLAVATKRKKSLEARGWMDG